MEATVDVVRRLIAGQFPDWGDLAVVPVPEQGNDNRTFRLGDDLAVRLPSHERYVAGVAKEDSALPLLARHLALPVPVPVATGRPTQDYPLPWSVRHWLPGETPDPGDKPDLSLFAQDLGTFLRELRAVPARDGPAAGLHSFYRGCHPSVYGDQVQQWLAVLAPVIDAAECQSIWHEAQRSAWRDEPVWFHGDLASGNLLVADGRLSAVIDFGTCGVGDPACDLVIAWTFLEPGSRQIFRAAVGLPDDVWARARGWALWKALATLVDPADPSHDAQAGTLARLLADPVVGD